MDEETLRRVLKEELDPIKKDISGIMNMIQDLEATNAKGIWKQT